MYFIKSWQTWLAPFKNHSWVSGGENFKYHVGPQTRTRRKPTVKNWNEVSKSFKLNGEIMSKWPYITDRIITVHFRIIYDHDHSYSFKLPS